MAQHDFIIDNQAGALVRSDVNDALEALVTLSSGPIAPTVTYANMFWFDTATGQLKQRDSTNTTWDVFDLGEVGTAALRDVGTASGDDIPDLDDADARYLRIGQNLADIASPSTAQSNLGLGDAATKSVGLSSGNVLEVGAFGLGSTSIATWTSVDAGDDLNNGTSIRTGLYSVANTTANRPSDATDIGLLLHQRRASSIVSQMFFATPSSGAQSNIWIRSYRSGWRSWEKVMLNTEYAPYTGSSYTNTSFPVGTILAVQANGIYVVRNESKTIYLAASSARFVLTAEGAALSGTWRQRGDCAANLQAFLFQRVA